MIFISGFILGILLFPAILFLRARRDPAWDESNLFNIYRVIAHLGAHPSDFAEMTIGDIHPFWYISKDEYSEVVKTRK
jgi:hypothetical protein